MNNYFLFLFLSLHSSQSRCPPVPFFLFLRSMLLPLVQSVLLWWTLVPSSFECHGRVVDILSPLLKLQLTGGDYQ